MRLISTRKSLSGFNASFFHNPYSSNKVKRAEAAINEYRNEIDTRRPENYGFASMAAVPFAHIVANMLRNKKPKGTIVSLAPNPKDIVRVASVSMLTSLAESYLRSGKT